MSRKSKNVVCPQCAKEVRACGKCELPFATANDSTLAFMASHGLPSRRLVYVRDCGCRASRHWFDLFLAIRDSGNYALNDSLNDLHKTGSYQLWILELWEKYLRLPVEGSYESFVLLDLIMELEHGPHTPNFRNILKDLPIEWVSLDAKKLETIPAKDSTSLIRCSKPVIRRLRLG